MINRKDLSNLIYLRQEIDHIQEKIDNYKPAEIVVDSVRGSSPVFPFTEHSIRVEGLETKKDKMGDYMRSLRNFQEQLQDEEIKIELEIEKIPFSEIRQIIRLHYIEGYSYIKIMFKMGYNAPETPRLKVKRYLEKNYIDFE